MRPGCHTDRKHQTHCSITSVRSDWIPPAQVPIAGNHRFSLLVLNSSLHHHSLGSIHLKVLSCWVERMHPFAARIVDSRPSVLHPSGGHNCLTRCRLQMFLKPQNCVEYGNQTREHQSGHQSSYWLWTSVLSHLFLWQIKDDVLIQNFFEKFMYHQLCWFLTIAQMFSAI